MSDGSTPVLDTIGGMTAVSLELCELAAREHMIARLAALIAVGAPPLSYLANAGVALRNSSAGTPADRRSSSLSALIDSTP